LIDIREKVLPGFVGSPVDSNWGFFYGDVAIGEMSEEISINECKKLHLEQWVKVYGVVSNRCEYINTCQVYQLETVAWSISRGWFEDIVLQPVDEEERSIFLEEVMKK
jgi:hypothetical protein